MVSVAAGHSRKVGCCEGGLLTADLRVCVLGLPAVQEALDRVPLDVSLLTSSIRVLWWQQLREACCCQAWPTCCSCFSTGGLALVKQLPCATAEGMRRVFAGQLRMCLQPPAPQPLQVGLNVATAEALLAAGVRAWALRLCMSPAV